MTSTADTTANTPSDPSQEANLVVIRISDSGAMNELNKKVLETAAMYPSIPGAGRLAALGASPLENPAPVDGAVVKRSGFRAVTFRVPGTNTTVLMALGSATKVDLREDDNQFVALLSDTVQMADFTSLWVADFARLLRSIDYLSYTWKAIRHNCRYVRHAGSVIDTTSPTAEIQFLFEALSAAADARSTVRRTTVGKMRAYTNGQCPLSPQSVPRGFAIGRDRKLRLASPVPVDVVRSIIQVLGDPTLTNAERVARVSDVGAYSFDGSRSRRRGVRLDGLSNPAAQVARWYELLEVWHTGIWVVDVQLPELLSTTVFDLPVEIIETHGARIWRMTFSLPMPDGGWATSDEFEAAILLRDQRAEHIAPRGGTAAGSRRKPLCGLPAWDDGEWQYALMSRRSGVYELRRRPLTDAYGRRYIAGEWRWVARGWGRRPHLEGEAVGKFDASHLHRVVTEGLVEAAVNGLALQRASQAIIDTDGTLNDEMVTRLQQLRRQAENARRNANDAHTENVRRQFLREYEEALSAAQAVENDLVRVAGAAGQIPIDADKIAIALAAVANEADHVSGEVADALREVLSGFNLLPGDQERNCRWESSLRVPLAGGTLTIGPATGSLEMGTPRNLAARRADSLAGRAQEAAQLFCRDGQDLAAVAQHLGVTTHRRVAQTIRDHLKMLGLTSPAASFLVAAGTPAARAVVWERLQGRPYPRHLPRPFASHIHAVYLEGEVHNQKQRLRRQQVARSTIGYVLAAGGWIAGTEVARFQQELNITDHALATYVNGRSRQGSSIHPFLTELDGGIGLVACPHEGCAGWATLVSAHPETPTGLLCPTCMRMPDPTLETLVFPDDYR